MFSWYIETDGWAAGVSGSKSIFIWWAILNGVNKLMKKVKFLLLSKLLVSSPQSIYILDIIYIL